MAPKKRSLSGSGTTLDEEPAGVVLDKSSEDEEDEDEPIMFSLDGGAGAGDDEEEDHGDVQYHLAGLDDDFLDPVPGKGGSVDEDGIPSIAITGTSSFRSSGGSPRNRARSGSLSPPPQLGASPILLSVLELVAAQAGEARSGTRLEP